MPLLLCLILALTAAGLAGVLAARVPRASVASPSSVAAATRAVEESVGRHRRLRAFLAARVEPDAATGLALSIALIVAIGGGLVLAILAYLIRGNEQLRTLDNGAARWGHDHASVFSTHGLTLVTDLGSWWTIGAFAIVVVAVESVRAPSRWIVPFLVLLLAGEEVLTLTVKHLADRARPALNPAAAALGPSFPSGHSVTAAAFYTGAAFLLARRRTRLWRATLAGAAAGIAVGVAASRVLLDVHWLSDVIAGVLLGWGWFAICSIAFGGRLLRFGAPAEAIVESARAQESKASGRQHRGGPRVTVR